MGGINSFDCFEDTSVVVGQDKKISFVNNNNNTNVSTSGNSNRNNNNNN